ncbi:DNA primase [uncultured Caudovirales phage]|uniref:DNA primase n=1 Tax=uncultured Caudovirales phage TaxID=2100421 RepID=A0A6J5M7Z5_9CAUD|nr:DNA primase [uncultured Caudovirales phage]
MIHIDLKYINLISTQLRNFKKKKDNLFNCSCPLCGDSDKNKRKARGYFFQKANSIIYKCHNCGASIGVANLLKLCFPSYHNAYILEKYKTDYDSFIKKESINPSSIKSNIDFSKTLDSCEHCTKVVDLPDNHYAKMYVLNRKISKEFFNSMFFTEDFYSFVHYFCPESYPNLEKNDSRLIIPFFSKDNKLIGFQGRSFTANKKLRYITIKFQESDKLIYGLERFSFLDIGYVVEGPIDSTFLPNCLASANSDLESVCQHVASDLVLIYDNEPRNKEIVKLLNSAINNKRKVVIWPKTIEQKDLNDMVMSGTSKNDLLSIIQKRTFSGLNALLEFNQWKKI